jgi:hypothetical protein
MPRDIEKFWRNRISKEVLKYCDHDIEACIDCHELAILIRNGGRLTIATQ